MDATGRALSLSLFADNVSMSNYRPNEIDKNGLAPGTRVNKYTTEAGRNQLTMSLRSDIARRHRLMRWCEEYKPL